MEDRQVLPGAIKPMRTRVAPEVQKNALVQLECCSSNA